MWRLDGTVAHLDTPQLAAVVDLSRPNFSVHGFELRIDSSSGLSIGDAWLLGLAVAEGRLDLAAQYMRGTDLIATFSESELRACHTEVYWRFIHEAACVGLEQIVSVHTRRSRCQPKLSVFSILPGQQPHLLGDHYAMFSFMGRAYSLVLFVHPSNRGRLVVTDGCVCHELFPGELEKGVIRRARLRAVFMPNAAILESARRAFDDFAVSAPPLTT